MTILIYSFIHIIFSIEYIMRVYNHNKVPNYCYNQTVVESTNKLYFINRIPYDLNIS